MPRFDRRRLIGAGLVSAGAVGLIANQALAQGATSGPPSPAWEVSDRFVTLGPDQVHVELADGPFVEPFELPFPPPMAGRAGVMAYRAERVEGPLGPVSAESLAQQLAGAKADRDAAAARGDVATASALLQAAETLIGQASPSLKSADQAVGGRARQQARAASAAISAARAQLRSVAGSLPSMQAGAGHQLTMAHHVVADATQAVKGGPADATSLVQSAQALYKQAYDAYQSGQYDRAVNLARGATDGALAARSLAPPPAPPTTPATPPAPPPPTF